jgi:ADP-ribosyl-[dinitrogen reductase] hydrolase
MPKALAQAKNCLEREAQHEETLIAVAAAERMAERGLTAHEVIAELGQDWVSEER